DRGVAGAVNDVGHSRAAISIEHAGVRQVSGHAPMSGNAHEIAYPLQISSKALRRGADSAERANWIDAACSRKTGVAGAREDLERRGNQVNHVLHIVIKPRIGIATGQYVFELI